MRTPIAIIGKAGIFPKAKNAHEYWENILHKVDCITDVPPSRWNIEDYYDPDPSAPDKTYCKRGGFIPDIEFNPLEFGLPPNIIEVTDVSQLLGLVVARDLMEDAGYGAERDFDRGRVGVVLGIAGGQKLITPLTSRLQYPIWRKVLRSSSRAYGLADEDIEAIIEKIKLAYVPWNEDAFPGLLGNVVAGRIANRLDLGGLNCVVDAACASSLAAVEMAMGQLITYRADMMITGGVDTDNSIFTYMCFSKTPAFSKSEHPKPFDVASDGMMVGEGIGMVLLKRLEDAERDGDTIYAVIKGIGNSSDGKYKSIYAPRPAGQAKALRRAYQSAGILPASVGLIEAHGTGTIAGDPAEIEALREVFGEAHNPDTGHPHIALGSVKSQIGHTKAAAGAAGLIKAALALHHKVLPPTINVTQPNPKFELETSPLYVNTETRPWIQATNGTPRRAGVSAFGFGGTNFHVVLEEYQDEHNGAYRLQEVPHPLLLHAETPEQLLDLCKRTLTTLKAEAATDSFIGYDGCLQHLGQTVGLSQRIPTEMARLGFIADSYEEAVQRLQDAISMLHAQLERGHPVRLEGRAAADTTTAKGIYYQRSGINTEKVVAMFPGQGSQYLEMGRALVVNFPPLRQAFGKMDRLFLDEGTQPVSEVVFPPPAFDKATRRAQSALLQSTHYAQTAIGTFSAGLYTLLKQAGFTPDFTVGHSFGELPALWAAGVLEDEDFFKLIKARGKAMMPPDDPAFDAGGMLAVKGDVQRVEQEVESLPGVTIANLNSNEQVVLAGPTEDIENAYTVLKEKGYASTVLPVSAAFHTSLVEHAAAPFAEAVAATTFHTPKTPVYSNTTGEPYPTDREAVKEILANHMLNPVLFKRQIENIYAAGGRVFVEIGPRSILTHLVENILGDKPHIAIALNASRRSDSDRQFRDAVVQLHVAGLHLDNTDPYQAPVDT